MSSIPYSYVNVIGDCDLPLTTGKKLVTLVLDPSLSHKLFSKLPIVFGEVVSAPCPITIDEENCCVSFKDISASRSYVSGNYVKAKEQACGTKACVYKVKVDNTQFTAGLGCIVDSDVVEMVPYSPVFQNIIGCLNSVRNHDYVLDTENIKVITDDGKLEIKGPIINRLNPEFPTDFPDLCIDLKAAVEGCVTPLLPTNLVTLADICPAVIANCGTSSVPGEPSSIGGDTVVFRHNDGTDEVICQGFSEVKVEDGCSGLGVGPGRMVRGVTQNGKTLIIDAAPEHRKDIYGTTDFGGVVDVTPVGGRYVIAETQVLEVCNISCRNQKYTIRAQANSQIDIQPGWVGTYNYEIDIAGVSQFGGVQEGSYGTRTGRSISTFPEFSVDVPANSCIDVQLRAFVETSVASALPTEILNTSLSFIADGGTS